MLKKPILLLQIKYKKFATSADLGGSTMYAASNSLYSDLRPRDLHTNECLKTTTLL